MFSTVDDYDVRDGSLRPGFGPEETSSRCLIEDHGIAKMYLINTKPERFFNGKWYPGTVISGPYQFDDEMPMTAWWENAFDDGDREFLSVDELQYCRIALHTLTTRHLLSRQLPKMMVMTFLTHHQWTTRHSTNDRK